MKTVVKMLIAMWLVAGCGTENKETIIYRDHPTSGNFALPQGEVGNAGHGVIVDQKIYLYDFVEAGIEKPEASFTDFNLTHPVTVAFIQALVKRAKAPTFPVEGFAHQISRLAKIDPLLARSLTYAFDMLEWRFINSDLKVLKVHGDILQLKNGSVIQIANRRGRTVYVNQNAWNLMDAWNQLGLIYHELIGALIQPTEVPGLGLVQRGERVREINSHLFSDVSLDKALSESFERVIAKNELPFQAFRTFAHSWAHSSGKSLPVDSDRFFIFRNGITEERALVTGRNLFFNYFPAAGDGSMVSFEIPRENPLHLGALEKQIDQVCESLEKAKDPAKHKIVFDRRGLATQLYTFRYSEYREGNEAKSYIAFKGEEKNQLASLDEVNGSLIFKNKESCRDDLRHLIRTKAIQFDPISLGHETFYDPKVIDHLKQVGTAIADL